MSDLDQLASASRTTHRAPQSDRTIRVKLGFVDAFWAGVAIALGFLVVWIIIGIIYAALVLAGISSHPRSDATPYPTNPQP
jgi:hypothetical protein